MGIIFKTYNGQHQLHLYGEVWVFPDKKQLDEVLKLFRKKELSKAVIKPTGDAIEAELNGLIVECKDSDDVKKKFGQLADYKAKYQKLVPVSKPKK